MDRRPDIARLRVEVHGPVDPLRLAATLRSRLSGGPLAVGPEHQVAERVSRAVEAARARQGQDGGSSWR